MKFDIAHKMAYTAAKIIQRKQWERGLTQDSINCLVDELISMVKIELKKDTRHIYIPSIVVKQFMAQYDNEIKTNPKLQWHLDKLKEYTRDYLNVDPVTSPDLHVKRMGKILAEQEAINAARLGKNPSEEKQKKLYRAAKNLLSILKEHPHKHSTNIFGFLDALYKSIVSGNVESIINDSNDLLEFLTTYKYQYYYKIESYMEDLQNTIHLFDKSKIKQNFLPTRLKIFRTFDQLIQWCEYEHLKQGIVLDSKQIVLTAMEWILESFEYNLIEAQAKLEELVKHGRNYKTLINIPANPPHEGWYLYIYIGPIALEQAIEFAKGQEKKEG